MTRSARWSAEIQGEFLAIHPFREGNAPHDQACQRFDRRAGRTARYCARIKLLREQSGTFGRPPPQPAKKDYVPMIETIREALLAAAAG